MPFQEVGEPLADTKESIAAASLGNHSLVAHHPNEGVYKTGARMSGSQAIADDEDLFDGRQITIKPLTWDRTSPHFPVRLGHCAPQWRARVP